MAAPNEAPITAVRGAEESKADKMTPTDLITNNILFMPPLTPTNWDEKQNSGATQSTSLVKADEVKPTTLPSAPETSVTPSKDKNLSKNKEESSSGLKIYTAPLNAAPDSGNAPPKQAPVSGQTLPNSHALILTNAKTTPVLCINPNKAVFSTAGGVSKHLMINKWNDRLAIKIRSSNNFFFRVNPVYSFLDGNTVNELEVTRLNGGGAKQDKLQLIYVICNTNDTDPTKLFGLRAKVRSVILPITTAMAN